MQEAAKPTCLTHQQESINVNKSRSDMLRRPWWPLGLPRLYLFPERLGPNGKAISCVYVYGHVGSNCFPYPKRISDFCIQMKRIFLQL